MIINANGEVWVRVMHGFFDRRSAELAFDPKDYIYYDPEEAREELRYVINIDPTAHII